MRSLIEPQTWLYDKIKIIGVTRSGISNSYLWPELGICFDVAQGLPFNLHAKKYFITHGHMDHAVGIPYIISQKALNSEDTGTFYMPPSLKEPLTDIMRSWEKIESNRFTFEFVEMKPLEEIKINSHFSVRCFPVVHRNESYGYTVFHKEKPLWTYSGDTQIEFINTVPWILKSKVLFIEATYLDDKRSIEAAKRWGHSHIDELIPWLDKIQSEKIVLIHVSSRYSLKEAQRIIQEKIPVQHRHRVELFNKA